MRYWTYRGTQTRMLSKRRTARKPCSGIQVSRRELVSLLTSGTPVCNNIRLATQNRCLPNKIQINADKNQHRLEEAQEVFKEIQNAYEILSDKHERAWYDDHRDQILRSGERHQAGASCGEAGGKRPDEEEELFSYFSASCFSGYGDGPKVMAMQPSCMP